MKPHLLCLNLNGMDIAGDTKGRKILPLGVGTQDVKVLRQIRASGYSGPIGILNHTNEDAEGRLLDNLDGLQWLVPQLDDAKPGEKPKYRTWSEKAESKGQRAQSSKPESVESMNAEFGKALKGGWVVDGNEEYTQLPFTIECRAKLDGKNGFNILVASEMKASARHWELYTMAKSGTLALYLPGRGGNYDSKVDVCDGKWHDFLASADEKGVVLWIDGKQVFEKPIVARNSDSAKAPTRHRNSELQLAFGRLVEGSIGCDGIIDDVRLSRGAMKPRKGSAPRLRMDNTLGLWDFDNLSDLLPPPAPKAAEFTPDLPPLNKDDNQNWQEFVNRERTFDFYGKQALKFMNQTLPDLIPPFPGMDGGQQGHWGNQNDQVTWKDGRWAASDLGSVFSGVFKGGGITVNKGVCVRFGDKTAVFDPERMAWRLEWSGGFIKLNDNRHGFMAGAPMDGKVISKEEKKLPGTYRGFFRCGKEVTIVTSETELPKPAAAQWPQWIESKGELGTQTPFATDRLTIPFENPYGTLFFITAHDFFSDGTAAIATMTGEVWLVKGIDEKLEKLRWKRFATGLHQPLGMKIVKDKLHVLGRDQITCLYDLNGDDEADFYECVTNAMQTSPGGHDFIVGLETDKEGRWYFASGNQGVCRINGRDQLEVLATGFRNPNGLGISADGRFISTSVQEGDWTPATSICQIELDHNLGAHFGAGGPKDGKPPEPVLMYMPRGEDNSASSQVFISSNKWAPLKGDNNLIHLSSGGGSAWLVMRQNVNGRWQAAATRLSGNFDSGPQCARFNPNDGHLYVNGMAGWGTYTPKDGCFQRLRFTGGDKPVPIGFEARDNGILVRFNQPVKNPTAATSFAQCWNYRYSAAYGSPEYSVRYPDTPGHDPLEIRSLQTLDAGKTLFLEIPQLTPASQIHLHLPTGHDLFLTAHALAEPYTDFPTYTRIAKTSPVAQTTVTAPTPSKPNPWTQDNDGRKLTIEAALGLQFVQKQLSAKPGEKLSLTFTNPDVVPHNWLLAKPGSLEKLGALCNLMITDPNGLAKHYVPDSPDVLFYTDMTNPNRSFTIHFTAPDQPGTYPYLCTFPGHWMIMNGQLKVE
jgi:azurin